jgi:hypothetical protein
VAANDFLVSPSVGGDFETYQYDTGYFDTDSIMIYSSYRYSEDPNDEDIWVHYHHEYQNPDVETEPIWQGGAYDDADKKPSANDASRVQLLYPLCLQVQSETGC